MAHAAIVRSSALTASGSWRPADLIRHTDRVYMEKINLENERMQACVERAKRRIAAIESERQANAVKRGNIGVKFL
jgi:Tfp pilus assembly protein PilP